MRTCQFRIPPFLMCFPPFAYGKALRAGATLGTRTLGIFHSLCHLPLGWENRIPKWLAYSRLVLGTRYVATLWLPFRLRISECLYKYPHSSTPQCAVGTLSSKQKRHSRECLLLFVYSFSYSSAKYLIVRTICEV